MIDERKLIEDFEKEFKPHYNEFGDYEYLARMNLKGILSVISKQLKVGEWIPCSERLPEKNGMYFITLKDLDFNGECHCFTEFRYYSSRKKKWDEGIERDNPGMEIIAWMPLPEPYKGD